MTWFFAVLVMLLVGGVAVVAVGHGDALAPAYDDRPDALVPEAGPITGADLRRVRFTTAIRGYRADEVDVLLRRLADELDARTPGPGAPDQAVASDPAPATPDEGPAPG